MAKDKNHKKSMRSCLVGHIESFHDTQAKMAAKKACYKARPSTKGVGDRVGDRVGDAVGDAVGDPSAYRFKRSLQKQRLNQLRANTERVQCLCRRVSCTFTMTASQAGGGNAACLWRARLLSSAGCADAIRATKYSKAHKHVVEVWIESNSKSLSCIIGRTLGQFFEFRQIQKRLVPAFRSRQDASTNIWFSYACSTCSTA
jgi:hypothetical protein